MKQRVRQINSQHKKHVRPPKNVFQSRGRLHHRLSDLFYTSSNKQVELAEEAEHVILDGDELG